MKCPLCGLEFEKEEARKACSACSLSGSCGLVRCPRCGYDSPGESTLGRWIKKWRRKDAESKR